MPSKDEASGETGPEQEPVVVPIEEAIDLHHFHPSEILEVVDAYLDAAIERGFREVRLIHGRGKGVQRARVQRFLAADRRVLRFHEAAPGRGGWGATLAFLDDSHRSAPGVETTRGESATDPDSTPARSNRGDVGGDGVSR
jgi:dsDNA-specific endonuclease/ATPase MutS2